MQQHERYASILLQSLKGMHGLEDLDINHRIILQLFGKEVRFQDVN
jgi:hypothetical protein